MDNNIWGYNNYCNVKKDTHIGHKRTKHEKLKMSGIKMKKIFRSKDVIIRIKI